MSNLDIRTLAVRYLAAAAESDWMASGADIAYDALASAAYAATRNVKWENTARKARKIAKLFDYQGEDLPLMVAALTPIIDGTPQDACYAIVAALEAAADAA